MKCHSLSSFFTHGGEGELLLGGRSLDHILVALLAVFVDPSNCLYAAFCF